MAVVFKCILLTLFGLISVQSSRLPRAAEEITITTIQEEPYLKMEGSEFKGFIPDLVKLISEKANFMYKFEIISDGKYGSQRPGGEWSGMIGEVMSQRARMAAAPVTISDERKDAVDFTENFMSVGNVILYSRSEDGNDGEPFSNIVELADQDEIEYGYVKDGMTENFFKMSNNATLKKMYKRINEDSDLQMMTNKQGIDKVRNEDGEFAMIMENQTADYWIHKTPCDLKIVGDPINVNHYGFVLRKGDDMLDDLNKAIRELKSSGKIEELRDKWWRADSACNTGAFAMPGLLHVALVSISAFLCARLT